MIVHRRSSYLPLSMALNADALYKGRNCPTTGATIARTLQQITIEEIDAAALVIDEAGRIYGWWPKTVKRYDDLDPIGKEDFSYIVARAILAAEQALSAASSE